MTAIQITIPTIFAVIAVAMCFFRRMPASAAAFAAFLSAGLLGVLNYPVSQYLIWGFIALVDTVNLYSTRLHPTRAMQLYTVTGCLAGCAVGIVTGSLSGLLVAGALGAGLGFLAYTRTPKGRAEHTPLARQLSLFAECACRPWFSFVMIAVVMSAIFG